MRVSLKWLQDYATFADSPENLAHKLTMAGLEVEEIEKTGRSWENIVVGRVDQVRPHPKADRLSICEVFDGSRTRQVICGAPNVKIGMKSVLAMPGAEMAGGMKIKEAKLRGELSEGMLCAEDELGLSGDHTGIIALPPEAEEGKSPGAYLGGGDAVISVGITPNRPDCLSQIGIAREVAALYGSQLHRPEIKLKEDGPPIAELAAVDILAPEHCPRYAARVILDVKIGPSPRWMVERLESAGLRSINNVVDVTNYILLEIGQPMHAFDFDFLRGHRIVVKTASAGEKFVTLDGVERNLGESMLMICDGEGSVALAGIMGGLNSEVKSDTKTVLLESAYFNPVSIRRTSKGLELSTEASYRFERGIDPDGAVWAVDRAAALIQELAGGRIAQGVIDRYYPEHIARPQIELRTSRTNFMLGAEVAQPQIQKLLESIEIPCRVKDTDTLVVTPPSFRPDLTREIDIIEEIARLYGYDNIAPTLPAIQLKEVSDDQRAVTDERIKEFLVAQGLTEVFNYAFIAEKQLEWLRLNRNNELFRIVPIQNPLSADMAIMRTTLIPGLLSTALRNLNQGAGTLKLFELGPVFQKEAGQRLPQETKRLSGLLCGKRDDLLWRTGPAELDFYDLKSVIEGLLDSLGIKDVQVTPAQAPFLTVNAGTIAIKGEALGCFGELHPEVGARFELTPQTFIFELHYDKLLTYNQNSTYFNALPRFPAVYRDLALLVEGQTTAQDLRSSIFKAGGKLLTEVAVFDFYQGPQIPAGKRSLAFHLKFQDPARTLKEEEVSKLMERIARTLKEVFKAEIRS